MFRINPRSEHWCSRSLYACGNEGILSGRSERTDPGFSFAGGKVESEEAEKTEFEAGITSLITPAISYISEYCDRPIKVEELAAMCHISETHLRRVFHDCMQMSPVEYINSVRIRTACRELKRTNDTVGDIAVRCGFTTLSTFNRNFHRIMGISPQQWRKDPEHYERELLNYNIKAEKGW